MSFQALRALIETRVNDAFSALSVPVVFDNVGGEPPASEYVELAISYTSTTEPTLCPEESGMELIRGDVQLAIYAPRGNGMGRLETLATEGLKTLNKLNDWALPNPGAVYVKAGQVLGPVYVTTGNDPLVVANVSAPFTARV